MRSLARKIIWDTAQICFLLFEATGFWPFHWAGNNLLFVSSQGRFPNRKNPNIVDMAFWNKFDRENIALGPFVDKELVKHFVRGVAPEVRVPETYDVFRSIEDLKGFHLPQPYVAKPTHSSGVVVLKPEGGYLSEEEMDKLRPRMARGYYRGGGEIQYRYMEKKLIVEEFVGTPPTVAPDFKFQFFDGVFQHCYVLLDRYTDPKPLFIDETGSPVPLEYRSPLLSAGAPFFDGPFRAPEHYQEMVLIAEKLSRPFRFCRVDLFPQDGEVFFGELTFSPGNCLFSYIPESFMTLVHPDHTSG